jgi:hypothetical protein
MKNEYQTPIFTTQRSLTDYQRQERTHLGRMIAICAVAVLLFVGLGIAGSFEVGNYQVANGIEVSR